MFRHICSLCLLIFLLNGSVTALAWERHFKETQIRFDVLEEHSAGDREPSENVWRVYYFVADEETLAPYLDAPAFRERFANGVTLPLYMGYLVLEGDFALRYVDKCGWDPGIAQFVDEYNAIEKGGNYYASEIEWVPRWSEYGAMVGKELIFSGFNICKAYRTIDKPPRDDMITFQQPVWFPLDVLKGGDIDAGCWLNGIAYADPMDEYVDYNVMMKRTDNERSWSMFDFY